MQKYLRYSLPLCFFLFLLLAIPYSSIVTAQEDQPPSRLEITKIDSGEFPLVRIQIISTDASSNRAPIPEDAQILENETPVSEYELGGSTVGSEVIFVVDANANIGSRDDASGRTRLEKIRESIVLHANM